MCGVGGLVDDAPQFGYNLGHVDRVTGVVDHALGVAVEGDGRGEQRIMGSFGGVFVEQPEELRLAKRLE